MHKKNEIIKIIPRLLPRCVSPRTGKIKYLFELQDQYTAGLLKPEKKKN
jgi:hypothetical protein